MYMPAAHGNIAHSRMVEVMNQILASPAIAEKFATQGVAPGKLSGADFTSFVDAEIKKWAVVVKTANVPLE
jgi:tripartite-type tricarboxylate transporter receptor subunit TctC